MGTGKDNYSSIKYFCKLINRDSILQVFYNSIYVHCIQTSYCIYLLALKTVFAKNYP